MLHNYVIKKDDFEIDLERKHGCDGIHFGSAYVKIKLPHLFGSDWKKECEKIMKQILKNQRIVRRMK